MWRPQMLMVTELFVVPDPQQSHCTPRRTTCSHTCTQHLVKSRDVFLEQNKMAADSGNSASFNVQQWSKAVGLSSYTAATLTGHGYVNYERCVNLSEEDVRAVVVDSDSNILVLMNRVKELRQFTEEDAVKLLSVSTRNKCTVCIGSCFLVHVCTHVFELGGL